MILTGIGEKFFIVGLATAAFGQERKLRRYN